MFKVHVFLILVLLSLSGCGTFELFSDVAKRSNAKGGFKVGDPYQVDGQWYNPTETYSYTQTGIASWYGPGFHGKRTANGERYSQRELTAAHKTLQMPSLVRVTNLENGKSVIVRVNDRGPFSRGRVMDVSEKAADLLGFKNKGTAKVKLQLLAEESRKIAEVAKRGESTNGYEVALNEQAGGAPISESDIQTQVPGHVDQGRFYPDPVVHQLPVSPTSIYVQMGSFSDEANATALVERIRSFGTAHVEPAMVHGQNFYRVRFGPVPNVEAADGLLARLGRAGYGDAMTIVD